jgi:hypothetical protein
MDRNREILVEEMVDIQIRGIRKLTPPEESRKDPSKKDRIFQ